MATSLSIRDSTLEHACHNKHACEYLGKHSDYSDWIITTAFYSALHFVDYKLFPLKFNSGEKEYVFLRFEDYYGFYVKNITRGIGRHKVRLELVEKRLIDIAHQYNKLLNLCTNARYFNYKLDSRYAVFARETYLAEIEAFCT